jgi:hypothetical protein
MAIDPVYLREPKYESAVFPVWGESDIEHLSEQVWEEQRSEGLGERVLDALAASVWETSWQTSSYRQKGEDTLSWGDSDNWIQIKWIRCLVESPPEHSSCLRQYGALQRVVTGTRLYKLEEVYSLSDAQLVRPFLLSHPQLIGVLLKARPHLSKYFGPDLQVVLKVVRDPEAEDSEQLFAYIYTSLPTGEAVARLDRLDEEWFLDQLDQTRGLFNFNLVFL